MTPPLNASRRSPETAAKVSAGHSPKTARSTFLPAMLFAVVFCGAAHGAPLVPIFVDTSTGATLHLTGAGLGAPVNLSDGDPGSSSVVFNFPSAVNPTLHAQSAGRSAVAGPPTIAANASYEAITFTGINVRGQGQASQTVKFGAGLGPLTMHFVLPELLLEFSDNVERIGAGGVPTTGNLFTQIQAQLCINRGTPTGLCALELVARLDGHFGAPNLAVSVTSDFAGLDLTAFDNQVLTIVDDGFIKTATWTHPFFEGDVDLSAFAPGIIEVSYEMAAIVEGRADITTTAASLNDPLNLAGVSLDGTRADGAVALPEPGSLSLLVTALVAIGVMRRRIVIPCRAFAVRRRTAPF